MTHPASAAAPAASEAPQSLDIAASKPNGKAAGARRAGAAAAAKSTQVETELAALEDAIVAEDKEEARRAKSQASVGTELEELPESEEETEQPDEEELEPESRTSRGPDASSFAPILEAFSKFESRVQGIEQLVQGIAQSGRPAEEPAPFTIGELPEGFDVMSEPMNKLQGYVQDQILEVRRGMQGLASAVQDAIDEIHVNQVRKDFKVSKAEEDEFCSWADEHGILYENPQQLEKALGLYRKVTGVEANAKKQSVAPETALANPKARPTGSRTFDKDLVRKPGRSTFDDAFNHAVQVTNQAIRNGAL